MAVAQGLCTNLLEYAWKINLQLYCPNSAAFTAFMGDVASFTLSLIHISEPTRPY